MQHFLMSFFRLFKGSNDESRSDVDGSSNEDQERLINKESAELELQHQLESLKASYNRLKQWMIWVSAILCLVLIGLAIPVSAVCTQDSNDTGTLSPVPLSMDESIGLAYFQLMSGQCR